MPATNFITPEQFVNRYQLTVAFKNGTDLIEQYIKLYEKKYVYKLFGKELADSFYLDFDTTRFNDIKEDFTFEINECGHPEAFYCSGLTDILLALIFMHYSREQLQVSTSIGQIKPSVEAGSIATDAYTNTMTVYNQAVMNSIVLQRFLYDNKTTYPEYKGTELQSTWFI